MNRKKTHSDLRNNDDDIDSLLMRLAEYEEKGEADPSERPVLDDLLDELDSFVQILQTPLPAEDEEYLTEDGCLRAMQETNRLQESLLARSEQEILDPELTELGPYQILNIINTGGMGTVYLALHKRLGQEVALKTLPQRKRLHKPSLDRFDREMRLVGGLKHPRIVKAYDAGEADGVPYLAMERVEGIDLSTLLKRTGTLAIDDACELIRQTTEGLQHIHEQGLVHRDLKPSNLMLTNDGEIKILDLGLAQYRLAGDEDELTRTGQMMGTIDYMAPEQALDSHNVDIRADIYSLGVSLFKLLAGVTPFGTRNYSNLLMKTRAMLEGATVELSEFRQDVSPELKQLIQTCLEKYPEDRFQTPHDLMRALEPFCRTSNVPELAKCSIDTPASPRVTYARHPRKPKLWWGGVFLTGAIALMLFGYRGPAEPTPSEWIDSPQTPPISKTIPARDVFQNWERIDLLQEPSDHESWKLLNGQTVVAHIGNSVGALASDFTVDKEFTFSVDFTHGPSTIDNDRAGIFLGSSKDFHIRLSFSGAGAPHESPSRASQDLGREGMVFASVENGIPAIINADSRISWKPFQDYRLTLSRRGSSLSYSIVTVPTQEVVSTQTIQSFDFEVLEQQSSPLRVGVFVDSQDAHFRNFEFRNRDFESIPETWQQPAPSKDSTPTFKYIGWSLDTGESASNLKVRLTSNGPKLFGQFSPSDEENQYAACWSSSSKTDHTSPRILSTPLKDARPEDSKMIVSPNGEMILTVGPQGAFLRELEGVEQALTLPENFLPLTITNDGRESLGELLLESQASAQKQLAVWRLETGLDPITSPIPANLPMTIREHQPSPDFSEGVAFSGGDPTSTRLQVSWKWTPTNGFTVIEATREPESHLPEVVKPFKYFRIHQVSADGKYAAGYRDDSRIFYFNDHKDLVVITSIPKSELLLITPDGDLFGKTPSGDIWRWRMGMEEWEVFGDLITDASLPAPEAMIHGIAGMSADGRFVFGQDTNLSQIWLVDLHRIRANNQLSR